MTPYSRNATLPADWKWAPYSTLPLHTPTLPPRRLSAATPIPLSRCGTVPLRHYPTTLQPTRSLSRCINNLLTT
jgi:hypothetical protein